MKKRTIFIDYQKLLDEIKTENNNRDSDFGCIKNGILHTALAICRVYGEFIQNNFRPYPLNFYNSRTEIYLSASAIARKTGYHPRSVQNHLQHLKISNIIEVYNVYGSTYKITVPLRFYFKAQDIEHIEYPKDI